MRINKVLCEKATSYQLKELEKRKLDSQPSTCPIYERYYPLPRRMSHEVTKFSEESGLLIKGYWLYTNHVGNSKGFAETVARAALEIYAN